MRAFIVLLSPVWIYKVESNENKLLSGGVRKTSNTLDQL